MTACLFCAQSLDADSVVCSRCGRPQWPAGRYNVALSVPLVGLAVLAGLAYWALAELIFIPATQPLSFWVADGLGLAFSVGEPASRTFFNGRWLVAGALLYIPLVATGLLRFGFRRTAALASISPLAPAFMDNWTWAAGEWSGIVPFGPVLLATGALAVGAHYLFQLAVTKLPGRLALLEARRLRAPATALNLDNVSAAPLPPAEPVPHAVAAPPAGSSGMPAWAVVAVLVIVTLAGVALLIYALNA